MTMKAISCGAGTTSPWTCWVNSESPRDSSHRWASCQLHEQEHSDVVIVLSTHLGILDEPSTCLPVWGALPQNCPPPWLHEEPRQATESPCTSWQWIPPAPVGSGEERTVGTLLCLGRKGPGVGGPAVFCRGGDPGLRHLGGQVGPEFEVGSCNSLTQAEFRTARGQARGPSFVPVPVWPWGSPGLVWPFWAERRALAAGVSRAVLFCGGSHPWVQPRGALALALSVLGTPSAVPG